MKSLSQIYIMTVFGVKYRLGLIEPRWEGELHAVIANSLKKIEGVMPIAVGGYKDHIHILYSTNGTVGDKEIMSRVKVDSSKWVNRNRLTLGRFGWQAGGGFFSYSKSQVSAVKRYILNQTEHHRGVSFREEYEHWLKELELSTGEYDLPDELI